MSDTKPIPLEELILRNQSLHDAGNIVFDTFHRYQRNIKKIRALGHSITRMDAADNERALLLSALNDAIAHAELEIDAEMPMLMATVARGNGMHDREPETSKNSALNARPDERKQALQPHTGNLAYERASSTSCGAGAQAITQTGERNADTKYVGRCDPASEIRRGSRVTARSPRTDDRREPYQCDHC